MHMRRFLPLTRGLLVLAVVAGFALVPTAANADPDDYEGPIFGIDTTRDGRLLVADYARGVVRVGPSGARLIADLPEVQDVTPAGRRQSDDRDDDDGDDGGNREREGSSALWAITSGEGGQLLYRIDDDGDARRIADLFAFEQEHNPHPFVIESNPFDVEDLGGGRAAVADAAGNDLLRVNRNGRVRLIAVFPDELVSTENWVRLTGENLPPELPAEAVPTSVAIGPDGAYYVGELKGFPAPLGESRVWRIERGARNVKCGESPKCTVVLDGLTSIVDLVFGPDGKLYVAQLDDQSWLAVELALGGAPITLGGSVRACDLSTGACAPVLSARQPILTSITFRRNGSLWGAVNALLPTGDVVQLVP
jgi:hypothetical protein